MATKYFQQNRREENFPNLQNEMTMSSKEAYRTPNRLDQKRNPFQHIIIKTTSVQNKKKNTKRGKGKRTCNI